MEMHTEEVALRRRLYERVKAHSNIYNNQKGQCNMFTIVEQIRDM